MPDKNLKKYINEIYLHQNEHTPITKLQLRRLTATLFLGNKGIEDLTCLENCVGVTGLYLSYNSIDDLTPLCKLTRLNRLV